MIKNILGIVWSLVDWMTNIFKAKNSKEMKAAKTNQQDELEKSKTNDAIEKRDTKEIQNELSE